VKVVLARPVRAFARGDDSAGAAYIDVGVHFQETKMLRVCPVLALLVLGAAAPAQAQIAAPVAGPGVPSYNPGVPSYNPGVPSQSLGTGFGHGFGHGRPPAVAPQIHPRHVHPQHSHTYYVPRRAYQQQFVYPYGYGYGAVPINPPRRRPSNTMDDPYFGGSSEPYF
jgi:hypothetical protein